jgi:glutamine amidotransferase
MLQNHHHPFSSQIANTLFYYFVHSYHFVPDNPEDCLAVTDYGETVTAIIAKENKIGTQFHPEKSQKAGLNLLSAFLNWHI